MSVCYYDCGNKECGRKGVYEECIHPCEKCGEMICESCAGGNGVYEDEENTEEENKECSINPDGCLKEEHCPICNINKSNEIKVIVGEEFNTEYYGKSVRVSIVQVL